MAEYKKIPWNHVFVEAVAIVTSILLAFAIDAWWEERQERLDELQELERLQIELESNISRIDQFSIIQKANEAGLAILAQIVEAQDTDSRLIEVTSVDLYLLSIAPTFEADSPVLDGLVRSGRLEIVEDSDVITALAAWERSLRDYSEVALIARQNSDTLLVPALVERGDIAMVLIGGMKFDDSVEFLSNMSPNVTLAIDVEISGLIAQKVRNTGHALSLLHRAKESAEQALIAVKSARGNVD